ncbi:unnamed protein product [Anisakis simplex]|uniref:2'-deoxynucleoside 5'-phosphate N-hydrolase 1 (inferred by orthology to a human protein) n=1 Tax=Anisakis simplex TaxID=6269 RepID=A0A0M3JW68_ANISI|nr:unnamed protein product [Anisakis simplex]
MQCVGRKEIDRGFERLVMKIYFCGSIRAGRSDAPLYRAIIEKLGTYGKVLTEHIGLDQPWNAAHLSDFASGQGDINKDKRIFETDLDWLHSADDTSAVEQKTIIELGTLKTANTFSLITVVVAECTVPSLGVGFELGVAWKLNLPTLILYRPNDAQVAGLSAMVRGVPSDKWKIVEYKEVNELDGNFAIFFEQHNSSS